MKKILLIILALFVVIPVKAETILIESNLNMDNFWQKNGKDTEKIISVARKIIHDNGLKRAPILLDKSKNPNATSNLYTKAISINAGILPYIDNDDELAFVIAHELSHSQEVYNGLFKIIAMSFNSKKYEYKADLKALDYMAKSGYNPVAGIIFGDKLFDEPLWDWGFTYTHPKGSKRLIKMYEYIYKKYPTYLNSQMAKNVIFVDFTNQYEKEINSFKEKQMKKMKKLENL